MEKVVEPETSKQQDEDEKNMKKIPFFSIEILWNYLKISQGELIVGFKD